MPVPQLALALSLCSPLDLSLLRSPCHSGGPFGFGCRLFPCRPLQLFPFRSVSYLFCVHQPFFNPAYFSTSFFNPYRGKLTVILASSPSPSRRTTVPIPYLGCSTVIPVRAGFLGGGGAEGKLRAATGGRGA